MRNNGNLLWRIAGIFLLMGILSHKVNADDPGITKVRLIQQTDTSYAFESDAPQSILSSLNPPVFPDRFNVSDLNFNDQSGWITISMRISTSGDPLSAEDEILLPWLRNGVDFTVQWLDGSTYKGLFRRSLNGIHIPLGEVMSVQKSGKEMFAQGFFAGLKHLKFELIHLIFILALAWYYKSSKAFGVLLWYTLGQAIGLILIEFMPLPIDMLFADLVLVFCVFTMAYSTITQKELNHAWVILLAAGLIHGNSYSPEIGPLTLETLQSVQSLFAFNLAIDLGQFALLGIFVLFFRLINISDRNKQRISGVLGGLAVFLLLLIFHGHLWNGSRRILDLGIKKQSVSIPVTNKPSTNQAQRGAGTMVTPIMAFLSVEPYEIRQEILLKAETVLDIMDPTHDSPTISISEQQDLKNRMLDEIREKSTLKLKGQNLEPVEVRANFIRLSRGGVTLRETEIEENVKGGIMGVTFVYDISTFPDSLYWDWQIFPESAPEIEASVVDPYGAITVRLNKGNHLIKWGSRLSGLQLLKVEPVKIEKYAIPLVSIIIFLILLVIVVYFMVRKETLMLKWIMIVLLAVAFVCYPYARTQAALPFLNEWKPSKERTGVILKDLITNVYRSFDHRKENDVYDRLSKSVTGDQLTEIYLKNRQAMELESRGGARANVDEVNILEIYSIEDASEDGFVADATWTVRGSVNHFGHTHYRQNQYRALVTFINDQEIWKISSIEKIDEQRIY